VDGGGQVGCATQTLKGDERTSDLVDLISVVPMAEQENISTASTSDEIVSAGAPLISSETTEANSTLQDTAETEATATVAIGDSDSPTALDNASKDEEGDVKKKNVKPRVVRERRQGIYTIQELEAANFLVEWTKGLQASAPYMLKLIKTYWSLSPTRTVLLVTANLLKSVQPSFELWLRSEFLDEVQKAMDGHSVLPKKLLTLTLLSLLAQSVKQGLELVT
jgi:hypothetical protein